MPDYYPPLPPRASGLTPRDRNNWVTVDSFDSTYYSGLDVSLFAGPFYVDEAVNIQWTATQNVTPYYPYHSYTFARAVPGTRLVQGMISINFTEAGYIFKLLDELKAREEARDTGLAANAPAPTDAHGHAMVTIQEALKGDVTLPEFLAMSRGGNLGNQPGSAVYTEASRKKWGEITGAFKQALWGDTQALAAQNPITVRGNRPLFDGPKGGFDIYLKFGEPQKPPAKEVGPRPYPTRVNGNTQAVTDPLFSPPAQIDASGRPIDGHRQQPPPVGTIHRLTGVFLQAAGQQIDDSGRPILEVYNFIARDLDQGNVTGL